MAITTFNDDMDIIVKLSDEPNDEGGLSAAELKAEFDKAGLAVQRYINEILLPELAGQGAAAALGAVSVDGLARATTVQAALNWIRATMDEMQAGVVADGSITAAKLAANAVAYAKLDTALQQSVDNIRRITVDTAQPSGGADGDLWIVVS